jgi:hypothetical protein
VSRAEANEAWDLKSLAALRGCEVVSAEGTGIGEMREILYDFGSETPVWVGVSPLDGFELQTLLIPVQGAVEDGGALRVAFSTDEIRDEPPADFGEGFDSLTAQRHIYDYFAVPFDETAEVRVLRQGDDVPALEAD